MNVLEQIAVEVGKTLVEAGIRKLGEVLSDDQVRATVASILPAKSETQAALEELEMEIK